MGRKRNKTLRDNDTYKSPQNYQKQANRNSEANIQLNNEKYGKEMVKYKTFETEKKSWSPENKILKYAAENNKREDLEYLFSIHKLENCSISLLWNALICGHEDLGKWFLSIGITPKDSFRHDSLLHLAARKGFSDVLNMLLDKRLIDTNARDGNRETALHVALRKENPTICRLLLKFGAKTDIPDRDGLLPLHRATKVNNSVKMIDLLLEFNADIDAIDEHSKCPLEYAFMRPLNKHVVVCHLIRQGAKVGTTFVSQGQFYGKNAVHVGHTLGMTTSILRAIRHRSLKTKDLSVLDCVNLIGDIGALVELLREDGNIMTLSELKTDDIIKRLLNYVEMTKSHRLYQCMKERGLSQAKTPPYVRKQDNMDTLAESLSYEDSQKNDDRDKPIPTSKKTGKHIMVLQFEVLDNDEVLLTRRKGDSSNKMLIDTNSEGLIVVVSPSQDDQSIKKVVKLAAQHLVHRRRGVPVENSLTFTHIQTSDFLADSSLPFKIANGASLENKLTLTGEKSPYQFHSLHHHVLHNEVGEVRKMLHSDKTVDVNAKDDAGWTTLNVAILLGEREMVETLLDHGATASLDMVQCLPAFVDGDWDKNKLTEISPLTLSVRLNLTDIVQLLTERNPKHPSMDLCIKLSYGLKVESVLLDSVCETAERKYQNIGARFKPTYTVHMSQPIKRVCLGFSDKVCDIEEKDDIHGVQIAIMNKDISPESVWIEDTEMTEDEKVVSEAIIDLWADYLWNQHPNLNAITAGSLVRVQYPENKPVGHIILHCSHKGYIPLQSERFPTELICEKGAMPVAVLEGEFRLGPKDDPDPSSNVTRIHSTNNTRRYPMKTGEHIPLRIGMCLSKSYMENEQNRGALGTLGTFVDMGNDKIGLVTCAHLFFENNINNGEVPIDFPHSQEMSNTYVIAPQDRFHEIVMRQVKPMEVDDAEPHRGVTENVYWECGKVVRALFDSTLDIGIDAALIEIDPIRVPRDGSFDNIEDTDLKKAAFDRRHPPTFTSGKQADMEYLHSLKRPIKCMKVGATSGMSVGILTCENGQVKVNDSEPIGVERNSTCKYIFKNQFVISEYNKKKFFELGDSGSAVFVIKGGRGHYYPDACLGIAFALGLKSPVTFVTPIGSILEKLKPNSTPTLRLKSFE